MRRIRRAAPGSGPPSTKKNSNATTRPERSGRVMARDDGWDWDDSESTSSAVTSNSKHEKSLFVQGGGGGAERSVNQLVGVPPRDSTGEGVPATMSLSEKLRQQELLEQQQQPQPQQQARRGPLMDSDHLHKKAGGGAEASIGSGWSWTSSSRGTGTAANDSTGTNDKSLRGRLLARAGPSSTDQKKSRFSLLKDVASSLPGPFKHGRSMSMVYGAFGEKAPAKRRVPSAQLHDGDQGEDLEGRALFRKLFVRIGPLVTLIALGGTFRLGRRRGHRLGEAEPQRSTFLADASGRGVDSPTSPSNLLRPNPPRPENPSDAVVVHRAVFPPHLSGLANLTAPYDPGAETPYFWDVPLSGESVAEAVFARCHRLVQACEFGLRQPDYNEDKLELFELDDARYVNVDLQELEGIQRAAALGLAPGRLADVIISPRFHSVSSQIFSSPDNPGRMFALFRHPVHRALSTLDYLAKATWAPRYNPKLATMSVEQYAQSKYIENNWMTRFLVDKPGGKLTHGDMLLAKKIIKFKCLVGLFDDIEVSMTRFQRYFGWSLKDVGSSTPKQKAEVAKCRSWHVAKGDKHMLHREGLTVREGSVAWSAIVRMNLYDMELYEYVRKIYKIQGEQIFDVVGREVVREASSSAARDSGKDVEAERSTDPRPGKSMAVDAFEDGSLVLDLAAHNHEAAGKSMAVDALEGEVFQPHSS